MANEKITVEVVAELQKAAVAFKGFAGTAERELGNISKSFKQSSGAFEVFQGVLASEAAIRSIDFLADSAKKLFDVFILQGIKAAQDEEVAINKLNFALNNAGILSKKTSDSMLQFAQSIQKTTTVSSGATLEAAALLETITKLDVNGLQKATKAAIDLSKGLGINLESATRLVAKAAEGSTSAFAKYGIEIRKGKTDAETFANTLAVLNSKFGGAAENDVNTYAGAIAQATNSFNDIGQAIGEIIIKNKNVIDSIKLASKTFIEIADVIKQNEEAILSFIGKTLSLTTNLTSLALKTTALAQNTLVLKGVYDDINKTAETGELQTKNTTSAIGNLGLVLLGLKSGNLELIKIALNNIGEGKSAVLDVANSLDVLSEKFNNIGKKVEDNSKFNDLLREKLDVVKSGYDSQALAITNHNKLTEEQETARQKLITSGVQIANQLNNTTPIDKYNTSVIALNAALKDGAISQQTFIDANAQLAQQTQDAVDTAFTGQFDKLLEQRQMLLDAGVEFDSTEIQANNKKLDTLVATENESGMARLRAKQKLAKLDKDAQKKIDDESLKQQNDFLSTAATLQQAKSKELAAIGKAAGITEIAIKTPVAVASAFTFGSSFGGPVGGFLLAAIAAAAMAAQASRIAGVPLATGGQIPGGFPNDSFPARLTSGERVLNVQENKDFTQFVSGNNQTNSLLGGILSRLERLENTIVVNIGGREIIREVQRGLDSGRILEVS